MGCVAVFGLYLVLTVIAFTERYCHLAETILPARVTDELVERSLGDLWLAELTYRGAAEKVDVTELRELLEEIVQLHTRRCVTVWKTTEQQAFREPANIFGKLEELHTNVIDELVLEDANKDVNARMRQIAEFHGTTVLPDLTVSTGVDVDMYLGCDTDDEDDVTQEKAPTVDPQKESDDEMAFMLDKTSKGYSLFMENYLFTASVSEADGSKIHELIPLVSSWRVTLSSSVP